MDDRRKNLAMAATVEKGIILKETVSMHQAALYLASGGVPLDVSVRVLTTPFRRGMEIPNLEQQQAMAAAPEGLPASFPNQSAANPAAPAQPVQAQGVPARAPVPSQPQVQPQVQPQAQPAPAPPPVRKPSWREIVYSSGPTFR